MQEPTRRSFFATLFALLGAALSGYRFGLWSKQSSAPAWQPLGPETNAAPCTGRISALAITGSQAVLCVGADGGIWRSLPFPDTNS